MNGASQHSANQTQTTAGAAPASPIRVEPPPGGCWLALSCELRITATPPYRLASDHPVVRASPALDVLSIEGASPMRSPTGPDAWKLRVIGFDSGALPLPALRVVVIDQANQRVRVEAPAGTVRLQERSLMATTTLADLETLLPGASGAIAWSAMLLGAAFIAVALVWLIAIQHRRFAPRASEWLSAARARRRAIVVLRRTTTPADAAHAYDRIVHALRIALTPRFGSTAMSFTSAELIKTAGRSLTGVDRSALAAMLARSDVARFGGEVPAVTQVTDDLRRARAMVRARALIAPPATASPITR